MPEQRDVIAELDSVGEHLLSLCGDIPLPGLDANAKDIASRLLHLKALAQNTIELAAEYASGVTHEERVRKSMGDQHDPQARIAELERQLEEARAQGGVTGGQV